MVRAVKWGGGVALVVLLSAGIGWLAVVYPDSLLGISLATLWGSIVFRALYRIGRRSLGDKRLLRMVIAGLGIRVPIVIMHLMIGFFILRGLVDFPGYMAHSVYLVGEMLRGNLEVFSLPYLSLHPSLGVEVVSILLAFSTFLIGPSLAGMFLFSGIIGFLGAYLFFRAFQAAFPSCREAPFLAACLFFFPSLAFWSSLLGKDSWIFFFLGWITYAFAHLLKAIRVRHLSGLVISLAFLLMIRPPIGIALVATIGLSLSLAMLWRWPIKGPVAILRPAGYVALGLVLAGVFTITVSIGLDHVGRYVWLPFEISPAEAFLSLAVYKHVGLSVERGSFAAQITAPEPTEALLYLPNAIFTFLFRPFIFEAHNMLALIAALDGTLLFVIVLWRWRYLLAAVRWTFARPFVLFCAGTFLLFSAMLSFESNFGAIVRHRSMVLPFLFILLSVPRSRRVFREAPGQSGA